MTTLCWKELREHRQILNEAKPSGQAWTKDLSVCALMLWLLTPRGSTLAPGGALLRGVLLRRLPRPRQTLDDLTEHVARLGARFDGRLRVAVGRRPERHRLRRLVVEIR